MSSNFFLETTVFQFLFNKISDISAVTSKNSLTHGIIRDRSIDNIDLFAEESCAELKSRDSDGFYNQANWQHYQAKYIPFDIQWYLSSVTYLQWPVQG